MRLKDIGLNSKVVAFMAMMGALGNILSAFSIGVSLVGQVGVDFSLIGTFIAAVYGGPFIGFLTGLVSGIIPGVFFGPMGMLGWLGLIVLPTGKALTGLTTGALYKFFDINRRNRPSLFTIPIMLVGYIPEYIYTVFVWLILAPNLLLINMAICTAIMISITFKGWMEIALMSFFMGALNGNIGFSSFMNSFFTARKD